MTELSVEGDFGATSASAPLKRPPGPPPKGAGILSQLQYGLNFLLDPMGFVGGRFQRYGDSYYVGTEGDAEPGLYVFRHPDQLEQVLVSEAKAFHKQHSAFAILSKVLGDGLLTTDGDIWRRQRRLLQPAFNKKRLDEYAPAMVSETIQDMSDWQNGEVRDITSVMMEMTLAIVCRTLFGHDSREDAAEVKKAMDTFQTSLAGMRLPLPEAISPPYWQLKKAKKRLDKIVYGLIDARKPGEQHHDLLQRLIDAEDEDGSRLSRSQIRDQLMTLFLAGHETTSNALSWAFHLLSQHPEVEAKLHQELDEVLQGRVPTAEDLPQLIYTEQVFNEAMRLYPPVMVIARKAIEDVKIGSWLVPEGSEVVMWVWHTQRDPRWFEEPWAFRPERFSKEAVKQRPRLAYLPFGAGARACIGKVFAQMEGVLILATLASRWRLQSIGKHVKMRTGITLSPDNLHLKLVSRN